MECVPGSSHRAVHGDDLRASVSTGLTDARIYRLHGMDPVVYGGLAENVHTADERVNVGSIERLTLTVATLVIEWCGVRPVG